MSSGWFVWIGIVFSSIVVAELIRLNILLYLTFKKELKFPNPVHRKSSALYPSVTVIVPAKDEQNHIRQTAKSILDSDYPNLKLVLVNDRSNDRTLEIMEGVAQEDSRVQVMSITELPSGWTGKTNAMFQAAEVTSSDILLFTDADAILEKDVISSSVDFLVDRDMDMLSLLPGFLKRGFLENRGASPFRSGAFVILSLDRGQ